MKRYRVTIKETNYGFVDIEVGDNENVEDVVYDRALNAYQNGEAEFPKVDFDIKDWEEN